MLFKTKKGFYDLSNPGAKGTGHGAGGSIGVVVAALFIIGEMAGAGLVAIPGAVYNAGWIGGIVFLILGAVVSGYTGVQLGSSWTILQLIDPKYAEQCRYPYPAIGQEAFGWPARSLVTTAIWLNMFFSSVAYILLAGNELNGVVNTFHKEFSFCYIMLIVFGVLLFASWLGTPADFWLVSVGAMATSSIATILVMVGAGLDKDMVQYDNTTGNPDFYNVSTIVPTGVPHVLQHNWVGFTPFAKAYGAIAFAYGGHAVFPTIQHDMKEPRKFWQSVMLCYSIIVCLYIPVGVVGYYFYGDLLANPDYNGNITQIISTDWVRITVSILIAIHVMFGALILLNPVNQEIETLLGIPAHFNIYRAISRTIVLFLALFIAESVPQFGSILNLIGSTAITLLTFVLPGIFHLRLKSKARIFVKSRKGIVKINKSLYITDIWEYLLVILIVTIGLLAGIAGLYAAVESFIEGAKFNPPCYLALKN